MKARCALCEHFTPLSNGYPVGRCSASNQVVSISNIAVVPNRIGRRSVFNFPSRYYCEIVIECNQYK